MGYTALICKIEILLEDGKQEGRGGKQGLKLVTGTGRGRQQYDCSTPTSSRQKSGSPHHHNGWPGLSLPVACMLLYYIAGQMDRAISNIIVEDAGDRVKYVISCVSTLMEWC